MTGWIAVTDQATAYVALANHSEDDGQTARIRISPPLRIVAFSLNAPDSGMAVMNYAPIVRPDIDLWGQCSAKSVELMASLISGYSVRVLIVEGLERLRHDAEAVRTLADQMPRLTGLAAMADCQVHVVYPQHWQEQPEDQSFVRIGAVGNKVAQRN